MKTTDKNTLQLFSTVILTQNIHFHADRNFILEHNSAICRKDDQKQSKTIL